MYSLPPFSSDVVCVPPLSLSALPPVSPHEVQPETSGRSSSSGDQTQEGGEDLVETVLMTPSALSGRQVGSDTDDESIFTTSGDTTPTSADKLFDELVELRAELRGERPELRADLHAQNEDIIT